MSGPRRAEERLGRLLVMLPWLMEVGEVPLADVAARYDLPESEVQEDLELVAMCGLPPFVDEMIDVFVDDGIVFVGIPRLFTRPLRLTAPEGFSLLASARAAMELPGADPDGPLGRGLRKLASALSDVGVHSDVADSSDDTAGVAIDLARPALTDDLAEAVAENAELRITYYSPARDELGERTIVPRHVFADSGNWYVVADDESSGQRRTFRIDRIESVVATGRSVETTEPIAAPGQFFTDADVPRAVIRLAPAAQWVVEQYPVDDVRDVDGRPGWVEVRLPVATPRWLTRLLIRLGPDAVVVEPDGMAADVAAMAAQVLAAYTR